MEVAEPAGPMSRYERFKARRSLSSPPWGSVACIVTAEDGTWGLGMSTHGAPVESIVNDHFAPLLVGEECMATEKLWDMMFRMASPYSSAGMASYAISAVDLALWDLKGKILGRPVYELLEGRPESGSPATPPATIPTGTWSSDLERRSWRVLTGQPMGWTRWNATRSWWPTRERRSVEAWS